LVFPQGVAMAQRRGAFPANWIFYPDWLTVEQVCYLSGWDADATQETMGAGGVDLNDAGLVAKDSLWDFQKVCALVGLISYPLSAPPGWVGLFLFHMPEKESIYDKRRCHWSG
jgi:hypothetical protein